MNLLTNQIKPSWQAPISFRYEWMHNRVKGTVERIASDNDLSQINLRRIDKNYGNLITQADYPIYVTNVESWGYLFT